MMWAPKQGKVHEQEKTLIPLRPCRDSLLSKALFEKQISCQPGRPVKANEPAPPGRTLTTQTTSQVLAPEQPVQSSPPSSPAAQELERRREAVEQARGRPPESLPGEIPLTKQERTDHWDSNRSFNPRYERANARRPERVGGCGR